MTRILVKARDDRTADISGDLKDTVQKALWSLSSEQLDRYYRANKVWYNTKTKTFEFEDRQV